MVRFPEIGLESNSDILPRKILLLLQLQQQLLLLIQLDGARIRNSTLPLPLPELGSEILLVTHSLQRIHLAKSHWVWSNWDWLMAVG
jgi:hypothetical protein